MRNEMSVKQWIGTILLLVIPVVNLVFLFIWILDRESPKRNFSIAYLTVVSSLIGLGIILSIVGGMLSFITTSDPEPYSYVEYTEDSQGDFWEQELSRVVPENQALESDLELIELFVEDIEGYSYLIGVIKNNSLETIHSGFVVEINLYDNSNAIIQTVTLTIKEKLPPGEKIKFDEGPVHSDSVNAELIKLRAKFSFE